MLIMMSLVYLQQRNNKKSEKLIKIFMRNFTEIFKKNKTYIILKVTPSLKNTFLEKPQRWGQIDLYPRILFRVNITLVKKNSTFLTIRHLQATTDFLTCSMFFLHVLTCFLHYSSKVNSNKPGVSCGFAHVF